MLKRIQLLTAIFQMVLLLSAVLISPSPADAKVITLTFSDIYPTTHPNAKLALAWCKAVEERTNGRVKILHYPGQSLTSGVDCYDGVVNGLSDAGQSVLQYTRGRFPLMDIINLPLGYPSGAVATAIINEINEKFQPRELQDTKVMLLHAHGPGYIHTKGKPINRMEDLKGLKIRSHGPTAEMLKLLGATPVALPMPELYQALQKGVVHGGVNPFEADRGWKLAEVVDQAIVARPIAYSLGFFIVMNKGKWASLPQDIRQIIETINLEFITRYGQGWDDQDQAGKEAFLEQGGRITEIEAGEAERWKESVQPVIDVYKEDTKKRNLPGDQVVNYVLERLEAVQNGTFQSPYMGSGN